MWPSLWDCFMLPGISSPHWPVQLPCFISQMRRLGEIFPDLAKVVLDSINLHLWYLTPQSVPLSLTDTTLSPDIRKSLAVKLSSIPSPTTFPMGKPAFPDISVWPDRLWLSGQVPELSYFLGKESWMLFNKLGLTEVDMEWLQLNPEQWELMSGYRRFRDFVKNL